MAITPEDEQEWKVIIEVIRRIRGSDIAQKYDKFRQTAYPGKTFKEVTSQNSENFIKDNIFMNFQEEIDAYKKTDKLMNLGTKISPDDDIYIDCKPTNIYGEEVNPAENIIDNNSINDIFDEINDRMVGKTIFENIGFQVIVAITLLAIIYFTGNFIFIKFPKKFVSDKNITPNPPSSE